MSDSLSGQVDSSPAGFQSGIYSTGSDGTGAQPTLIQPRGALAGIIADAVVREAGHDRLRLTDSPVERSAPITDHAYLEQPELELEFGYSDSGNGFGYSASVYAAILSLQATRQPFPVTTGKRLYENMMVVALGQTTDEKTEHALMLSVQLRGVVLVDTQASALPPTDQQAMPAQTADTSNTGEKQLAATPANSDTLLQQAVGGPTGYTRAGGSTPQ